MHAFAATREFKPHLILLDVIMPTMDGGDVAAQIQLDPHLKDTPVIFLTATISRREAGVTGLNSGGELFLAKPVSAALLMQRIQEKLRTAPREAEPREEEKQSQGRG